MSKSDKKEYRIRKIRIDNRHDLFDYCEAITLLSNNLYNAVRFRQRQVLTAVKKEPAKRTENEKELLDEISRTIKYLNALPPKPPTKKNPSSFTGRPKLPGYHKKSGHAMVVFTN